MDNHIKQKMFFLLIDDETDIKKTVRRHLVLEDFPLENIFDSENGMEALELIKELEKKGIFPNVIFADFRMNKMDGITFYETLLHQYHDRYSDICKFLITGLGLEEERDEICFVAESLGVKVIFKPFNLSSVIENVEEEFIKKRPSIKG